MRKLARKGDRFRGTFYGIGSKWYYDEEYPTFGSGGSPDWVGRLGLSRGELSVDGATEFNPDFRRALRQIVVEFPEVRELRVRFDGPPMPVDDLVQERTDASLGQMEWLHGTSDALLPSIEKAGLRPRRDTRTAPSFGGEARPSFDHLVYLTTQRNMARLAARDAAARHGGSPVVLRVAPPLSEHLMEPDEDSGASSALESLRRIGSIAYAGRVPAEQVEMDERVSGGQWGVAGIYRNPHVDEMCDTDQGLFHATSFASMESIAERGLLPRSGGGLFSHGGYGAHSQGKVFLACGAEAALSWFGKVEDQLLYHYQDEEEPDAMVPVLLMVSPSYEFGEVLLDEVGDRDVPGSVYVEQPIPPDYLFYWSPSEGDWVSVEDWGSEDPYDGVASIEHFDEDGDVVDEDDAWESRGFQVYGPHDAGGFKPRHDDKAAWEPL
jgi:hypothetical protein